MWNHRDHEVRPQVVNSTSAHHSRIALPFLPKAIQLGALFLSSCLFGLALSGSHSVSQLAFSNDGKMLIGIVDGYIWPTFNERMAMYGVIKVWDTGTGKTLARLPGAGWLSELALSPDGSTFAVAGRSPLIELWDLARGTKKGVITEPSEDISSLAFAPSGKLLASASTDGQVRLWDVAARRTRVALQVGEYEPYSLSFTPDGKTLATDGAEDVRFWDTTDGHPVNRIDLRDQMGGTFSFRRFSFLGFSADGKDSILTRHEGRHGEVAAVVDGATQVERFVFNSRRRLCIKLSPNSKVIAIGDGSGAVSILDATSGRTLLQAKGLKSRACCLAFSPDGTLLAGGDDGGRVRVWDTSTGRLRTSISCGDPGRRWGPTAAAILVWAVITIRLRNGRAKFLSNRDDPHVDEAAAQKYSREP